MPKTNGFSSLSTKPDKPFKELSPLTPSAEFKERLKPEFKSAEALYRSVIAVSRNSSESFCDDYDHDLQDLSLPFSELNDNSRIQITHVIKTPEWADRLVVELSQACYPRSPSSDKEMGLKMMLEAISEKDIYITAVEEYLQRMDWKECCCSVRFLTFAMFLFAENPKLQSGPLLNKILEEKSSKLGGKPNETDIDEILVYIKLYIEYYEQVQQEIPDLIKSTMLIILFKIKEKDTWYEAKNQREYILPVYARNTYKDLLSKLEKLPFQTSSVEAFSELIVMINNLSFTKLSHGLITLLDREVIQFEKVDEALLTIIATELFESTKIRKYAMMELSERKLAQGKENDTAEEEQYQNEVNSPNGCFKSCSTYIIRVFAIFWTMSIVLTLICVALEPADTTASLLTDFVAGIIKECKWLKNQFYIGHSQGYQ